MITYKTYLNLTRIFCRGSIGTPTMIQVQRDASRVQLRRPHMDLDHYFWEIVDASKVRTVVKHVSSSFHTGVVLKPMQGF